MIRGSYIIMKVEARSHAITALEQGFAEFWNKSVPIQDLLRRI